MGKDAQMDTITSSSPLELISIDFVHLENASGGHQYTLTVVDHFTRFLQTYATRNKSTLTAAKILYNDYLPRFGIPEKIHAFFMSITSISILRLRSPET